jgi:multidrug resistance efflux pump
MDLLLLLLYAGVCTAVFKIFKIPLNKWSVPTAILGGVVFLFTLLFWMNFKHPYAKYAKEIYTTTPIVPAVPGIVTEVKVEPNMPVEEGDILFQIDPKPYQLEVERLEARLIDVTQAVEENKAMLAAAQAMLEGATAERDQTKQAFERAAEAGVGAISQQEIDTKRGLFLVNQADLLAARANLRQIELGLGAKIDGTDTRILEIKIELEKARYDLERTTVRAPSRGLVTQLALRKGMMAAALPLRPTMVFVPTERRQVLASFWQNAKRNLEEGNEAEVIFDAAPGRIFEGKITKLLPVIPEAAIQPGGTLNSGDILTHHDRLMVLIELKDDLTELGLPVGVQGRAAAYTHHDALHSSPVRRILLRMMGWLNYLYPIKK